MATIKVFLNTRYKSKDNTFPIVIRIIDKEKIFYHGIGYKVKEDQFKDGQVRKHEDSHLINSVIDIKLSQAKSYIAECKKRNKPINFEHIFLETKSYSFIEYLRHRAKQYFSKGQVTMNFKVNRYAKELEKCFSKDDKPGDISFDEINQDHLRTFESFLINNGNGANTRAKKFQWLKMFYDNGVTDGRASGVNPFKSYRIPLEPVRKEKLTLANIKSLEEIELNVGPINDARNLFLFSYYCKGQRFETCITLQKKQIYNKRISFQSNKGKKFLSVLIHSKLQSLLEKYIPNDTDLVFPFIKVIETDPLKYRSQIGTQNFIVNRNLKKLAALCNIKPFSFHQSRHSVAWHLKQTDVSIQSIKDILGHTKTSTTEIYLQSLDDEALDSEMRKLYGD